jgi:hypothetical protein
MASAEISTYKLIRDLWPQKSIYEALFDNSPVLGLAKKDTSFGEKIRYIGVGYGSPQGIGRTFGDAKAYKTASKAAEFQIQKRSYYGSFSIDGLLWRTYKYTGNKAMLVDPMARESKNIMRQMKNDLSSYIHGDGVGALGRMTAASDPTTATVTLRSGADIRRVEVGMTLQTEATGATGGSINPGYVTVSAIGGTDTAPTITVSQASWTTGIPAALLSDYIYRYGTYDNAPLYGLNAWNPSHSGSPGTFLGVNRNLYAQRLAGYTLDGTKMSPRQRVLRAARIVADAGGKADTYIMSTRQWENLANELQSQGILRFSKVPAAPVGKLSVGVTYEAIELIGPTGRIEIFADPWAPDDVERCGDRSTLVLASLGELIHWEDDASPGSPMLEDAADAKEVRCIGDMAFYNECPAWWCRVSVTA